MRASRKTEKAVKNALEKVFDAYERRDLETFRRMIAPDPDVVMYGTGADEKRFGWKQIRRQIERDWAQSDAAKMNINSVNVSAAGSSACAAVDGTMEFRIGEETMSMPIRLTATLENRAGKWVFVQMHFSTPMQAPEGQSFMQ